MALGPCGFKSRPRHRRTKPNETELGIYSTAGTLLREIEVTTPIPPPPSCGDCVGYPSTIQNSVALSGDRLVVLTETNPWTGSRPWTTKLEVYNWRTGALLQTWPVVVRPFATNATPPLSVVNRFAAVVGKRLHVFDLTTGKEILSAPASGSPAALSSHGLVYAAPTAGREARLRADVQTTRGSQPVNARGG